MIVTGNTDGSSGGGGGGGDLLAANNLSDVNSAPTSRTNLGLGNVDNVSDADKPVSTLQQTALDLKEDLANKGATNGYTPLVGGKVPIIHIPVEVQGGIRVIGFWDADTNSPDLSALTLDQGEAYQVSVPGSTNLNGETNWKAKDLVVWSDALAGNYFKLDNTDDVISVAGATGVVTLTDMGLENVDNTSDADKPVSTAQQTALDLKADDADLTSHENDVANPHAVTKTQVGLDQVDNTSDINKPVSTLQQTEIDNTTEQYVSFPATETTTGIKGQRAYSAGVMAECIMTNTWVFWAVATVNP